MARQGPTDTDDDNDKNENNNDNPDADEGDGDDGDVDDDDDDDDEEEEEDKDKDKDEDEDEDENEDEDDEADVDENNDDDDKKVASTKRGRGDMIPDGAPDDPFDYSSDDEVSMSDPAMYINQFTELFKRENHDKYFVRAEMTGKAKIRKALYEQHDIAYKKLQASAASMTPTVSVGNTGDKINLTYNGKSTGFLRILGGTHYSSD
jgi:hypothetical protein